jgi:lysophospholipase L1-like esterase
MAHADQKHSSGGQYCRAPIWLRFGKRAWPILPLRSFLGLLIVLFCVIGCLALTEIYIRAKGGRQILSHQASEAWQRENAIINANNRGKISQKPVWNSAGHPYTTKPVSRRRILVLGDSFAWGDGNANMNYIWWRQLQWTLNRRGYWNVDVVSCGGLGGDTDTASHLLRDQKLHEKIGADLVIIGYVTNDPSVKSLRIEQMDRAQKEALAVTFRSRFLDRVMKPVLPNVAELLQERLVNKCAYQRPVGPGVAYPYNVWEMKLLDEPNWSLYKEVVMGLGKYVAQSDIPIIAVTLPNYPNWKSFSSRYRKLVPLYRKAGVPFYNTLKAFVRKYPVVPDRRSWNVNPANGHPGPRSTHFYAEQAADVLERDYAEFLGCKIAPPDLQPRINDWLPHNLGVKPTGKSIWEITFPREQMYLATLPVGKPHILLSFEMPVAIENVTLSGPALMGGELHVNAIDPAEGFDTGEPHNHGLRRGGSLQWNFAADSPRDQVTILRIVPAIDQQLYQQGQNTFTLDIDFIEPSVRL